MHRVVLWRACKAASLIALTLLSGAAHAQPVTLRVVSSFPVNVLYTQVFQKFVDTVNAAPNTLVRIQLLGGPEVIAAAQQDEALKSGTIDGYFGPLGIFAGSLPEGSSIALSNLTVEEMRARGAYDLLNTVLAKKLDATLLGIFATGNGFHIWLVKEPASTPDGGFDLKGLKLRAAPNWRGLFQYLGAVPVVMAANEAYTALERGVVDGNGWTVLGVRDFSWQKFTKYRIDPPWNQSDTSFLINLDTWKTLSPAAQNELKTMSAAYEIESRAAVGVTRAAEEQALAAAGVKVLTMGEPARTNFLDRARTIGFEQMAARDPSSVAALKDKFVK